jgi:A/G-specific adenine glycosylase
MLQQTQVATVLPYFERFIKRFPDVRALAEAREQEVLAAWSGLGYYRRARALHRSAKRIVEEGNGRLPDTFEGWLALPGVGRYTAGAIMSVAFGERYPILDGNVTRVLSRLFLIRGNPQLSEVNRLLWQKAEAVLPRRSVSEFNQALMELGALVCTKRNTRCLLCPLGKDCEARTRGLELTVPETPPRKSLVSVEMAAAVVQSRGRVLLYRRQNEDLMKDLWELPGGTCRPDEEPKSALAREARERYGLELSPTREVAKVRHHIMNRKITLHAYEARLQSKLGPRSKLRRWVRPEELDETPMSSMTLKVLRQMDE